MRAGVVVLVGACLTAAAPAPMEGGSSASQQASADNLSPGWSLDHIIGGPAPNNHQEQPQSATEHRFQTIEHPHWSSSTLLQPEHSSWSQAPSPQYWNGEAQHPIQGPASWTQSLPQHNVPSESAHEGQEHWAYLVSLLQDNLPSHHQYTDPSLSPSSSVPHAPNDPVYATWSSYQQHNLPTHHNMPSGSDLNDLHSHNHELVRVPYFLDHNSQHSGHDSNAVTDYRGTFPSHPAAQTRTWTDDAMAGNHMPNFDLHTVGGAVQGAGNSEEQGKTLAVPVSQFLDHHPRFVEVGTRNDRTDLSVAVPFLSDEAPQLKKLINKHLFNDMLKWQAKGDEAMSQTQNDAASRQFARRINIRRSRYVTRDTIDPQTSWFRERVVVLPHRASREGSVIFDGSVDGRDLMFSFWTPWKTQQFSYLMFVGSATLSHQDASTVLRLANNLKIGSDPVAPHSPDMQLPAMFQFTSARKKRRPPVISDPAAGIFSNSNDWLQYFPLTTQIKPDEDGYPFSDRLIAIRHQDTDRIKVLANSILFDNHVIWHDQAGEVMEDFDSASSIGTFRHHRTSSLLYMSKSELTAKLKYQVVLIPHEIPGKRARLFDYNLKGRAHTFTLWASKENPGPNKLHMFFFVTGGSLDRDRTPAVLQHAQDFLRTLGHMS